MSYSAGTPYSDSMSRSVGVSIALHVAIFLILFVKAALFPSEPIMIRHAIRVDVVGLPEKVLREASQAPAAPPKVSLKEKAPAVPPKKAPAPDLTKSKRQQQEALEKLKEMDAVARLRQQVTESKKGKSPQKFAGNALAKGDSLTGLDKIEFDQYFSDLEQKVKSNWHLPGWLSTAGLRAQIQVLIDSSGAVIKRKIIASSGNDVFDGQVINAIDQSAPFPPPPGRLKDVLSLRGIVFNFPD